MDIAAAAWRPVSGGATAYCAQGRAVHVLDLRAASQALTAPGACGRNGGGATDAPAGTRPVALPRCVVRSMRYNRDDVSSLAINGRGALLVAGDDSGEVRCAARLQFFQLSALFTADRSNLAFFVAAFATQEGERFALVLRSRSAAVWEARRHRCPLSARTQRVTSSEKKKCTRGLCSENVQRRRRKTPRRDGLQARVYELNNHSVIATLRGAHTSCIGAAAFLPLGAERCVATGALDCTVTTHDATTGRAKRTWDLRRGGGDAGDQQQVFNPPMVHAMATRAAGGGAPALCAQPHARIATCIQHALKCLAEDLCTLPHSMKLLR